MSEKMKFEEVFDLESKRLIEKYPENPSSDFEAMGILEQKFFDLKEIKRHGRHEKREASKELALALVHFAIISKRAFDFHSITQEEYDNYLEFSK
jgi:hypothetical protein